MQELLTVELPDGSGWEMPRYIAKKFYDFIRQVEKTGKSITSRDLESEWLKDLLTEDRKKISYRFGRSGEGASC